MQNFLLFFHHKNNKRTKVMKQTKMMMLLLLLDLKITPKIKFLLLFFLLIVITQNGVQRRIFQPHFIHSILKVWNLMKTKKKAMPTRILLSAQEFVKDFIQHSWIISLMLLLVMSMKMKMMRNLKTMKVMNTKMMKKRETTPQWPWWTLLHHPSLKLSISSLLLPQQLPKIFVLFISTSPNLSLNNLVSWIQNLPSLFFKMHSHQEIVEQKPLLITLLLLFSTKLFQISSKTSSLKDKNTCKKRTTKLQKFLTSLPSSCCVGPCHFWMSSWSWLRIEGNTRKELLLCKHNINDLILTLLLPPLLLLHLLHHQPKVLFFLNQLNNILLSKFVLECLLCKLLLNFCQCLEIQAKVLPWWLVSTPLIKIWEDIVMMLIWTVVSLLLVELGNFVENILFRDIQLHWRKCFWKNKKEKKKNRQLLLI